MKITRITPPPAPQPETEYQITLSQSEMRTLDESLRAENSFFDKDRVALADQVQAARAGC